jgi:hypothetical protein
MTRTEANVKWYDQYGRLSSESYDTISSARARYWQIITADDKPIFARWVALTQEGPIVLGEYRSP